jgi:hypothetical protein
MRKFSSLIPILSFVGVLTSGCNVVSVNTTQTEEERAIASAPGASWDNHPRSPIQRSVVVRPQVDDKREPTIDDVRELTNYAAGIYKNENDLETAFNAATNAFTKLEFLMSRDGVSAGNVKYTRTAYNLVRTLGDISRSTRRTKIADRCEADAGVLSEALKVQERISFEGAVPQGRVDAVEKMNREVLDRYNLTNKSDGVSTEANLVDDVLKVNEEYRQRLGQVRGKIAQKQTEIDTRRLIERMNEPISSATNLSSAYVPGKHKEYDSIEDKWSRGFDKRHSRHGTPENAAFYYGNPIDNRAQALMVTRR